MNAADTAPTLDRLTRCSAAVQQWFLQNDLQLNAGKSDVILLGTAVQLRSAAGITTIDIAGSSLPVALKLKSLGVTIDSHLRFDVHVREVVKACNHHTRALRHVRHVLSDETAQMIACSIIGSRLDYCNAILYGAPQSSLDKLQRAQNNLARVVCQRGRITDARPLLQSLHWLPIRERILYKTALLAFKTRLTSSPPYLADLLQLRPPTRLLRSSDAPLLIVPRTQTALATRAFSVAAPTVWNGLPSNVRSCNSLLTFRRHLKTHYFTAAYA